jgi:hypothetical protein
LFRGSTGNEVGRWDSSGRLLVGTSSTSGNIANQDKLAVVLTGGNSQGGISVTDYSGTSNTLSSAPCLRLQRSIGTTDGTFTALTSSAWGLGRIEFNGSNGSGFGTGATIEGISDSAAWGVDDHPGRLVFSTTADGAASPTERMRISQAGRVIIGNGVANSSEYGQLTFEGNKVGSINTQIFMSISNTAHYYIQFEYNYGGRIGSITTNGTAVAFNTSSDYRLKENIAPVGDGIARLKQLRPSRFNFISHPNNTVDGFIAHEVQEVVPEAINGEKDAVDEDGKPLYQGIDQSKLVPLLTAALQEAIGRIETLEAEVVALKGT